MQEAEQCVLICDTHKREGERWTLSCFFYLKIDVSVLNAHCLSLCLLQYECEKKRTGLSRGWCFCWFTKQDWSVRSRQDCELSTVSVCIKDKEEIRQMKKDGCTGFMRKQLDRVAKQRCWWTNRKRKEQWMDVCQRWQRRAAVWPVVKRLDLPQTAESVSQQS